MAQRPQDLGQHLGRGGAVAPQVAAALRAFAAAGAEITAEVRRAGLADILGRAGRTNVQGEEVQKLDIFANERCIDHLRRSAAVCIMGSEENDDPIAGDPEGDLAALFDPLDGSSNIDVGAPIGTIFGLLRRRGSGGPGRMEDLLQPGRAQVAAGYLLYGSSTMLVYSCGQGVHGFTLDPEGGDFLLHASDLTHPDHSRVYSVNDSGSASWAAAEQRWLQQLKSQGGRTARYIGSLVADFHRNLLRGGIFAYPSDAAGKAKLRLLYEAAPLAFLARHSKGSASDGRQDILDIQPTGLHQRTALFIGNRADVDNAETLLRG